MRIVITGGAYSGKTAIINELSNQGYTTVIDSGYDIISKLNQKYGVEGQKKWRLENYPNYQMMIVKRQVELESEVSGKKGIIFFDRGLHDSIAYCKLMEKEVPKELLTLAKKYTYDIVFLCDTISDFDKREHTGRISDKNRSLRHRKLLEETYKEYGFKIVNLPEMSIEKRIDFIKKYLNLP